MDQATRGGGFSGEGQLWRNRVGTGDRGPPGRMDRLKRSEVCASLVELGAWSGCAPGESVARESPTMEAVGRSRARSRSGVVSGGIGEAGPSQRRASAAAMFARVGALADAPRGLRPNAAGTAALGDVRRQIGGIGAAGRLRRSVGVLKGVSAMGWSDANGISSGQRDIWGGLTWVVKTRIPASFVWQGFGTWRLRAAATLGLGLACPVQGGLEEPVSRAHCRSWPLERQKEGPHLWDGAAAG
jgi:hypothetical protein